MFAFYCFTRKIEFKLWDSSNQKINFSEFNKMAKAMEGTIREDSPTGLITTYNYE